MAGIDVGGHGGKRASNHEIPLIPFIDFLLCLVMFLLVTAVWNHMSRLEADAKVPGKQIDDISEPKEKPKDLHVEVKGERKFTLAWKQGTTVINTVDVPMVPVQRGDDLTYPALAEKVESEWRTNGTYRSSDSPKFDRAVLHTDNSIPFEQVLAVIDAVYTPQRAMPGTMEKVPAFAVTFAID